MQFNIAHRRGQETDGNQQGEQLPKDLSAVRGKNQAKPTFGIVSNHGENLLSRAANLHVA